MVSSAPLCCDALCRALCLSPFPRGEQIRSELKALGNEAEDLRGPSDRQKLLVRMTQEYVRHLNDVIRGEYRDRLVVTHAELRLYTR
jgi:interferon-induced GTP-binding protein Mx1